eukprot:TRINITY_DN27436_c0_g1_i1.p1 TRINITY_DN27436_c0_g1~~TRINITY_DN27436_c0_g1_i1.p1  ORF type:complete len:151 (-),score=20.91 TRINITY_DN27436_c0_g1_i1:76-483(-)
MYDTAHRFIEAALRDILEASGRKHNELRKKCQTVQQTLQSLNKDYVKSGNTNITILPYRVAIRIKSESGDKVNSVPRQWDVLANLLIDCIQLACETHQQNITEPALDCLQVYPCPLRFGSFSVLLETPYLQVHKT